MKTPLINMKNIVMSFGGIKALKGVDLVIQPGEIHCLAGENGCGKSTLIKVLSGVYTPDAGEIYIDGKLLPSVNPMIAIQNGIQVIYQDFSIFPNLSVAENIALPKLKSEKSKLINWKSMKKVAKEALDKINIQLNLDEKLENLSVANKQLVAISRALIQDAKLIVMDEPTTALTHKEVNKLYEVILDLKSKGISVLFVSHKMEEIFTISEKITVLRSGQNVVSEEATNLNVEKLVYHMTGRKLENKFFEFTDKGVTPTIELRDFGLTGVFENINLSVKPGEIVGLTGLLGSGRTELAEALFGIHPHNSGEVIINNKVVKISDVRDAINNRIVYVPEDRLTEGLFLEHSIENNLIASNLRKFIKKSKTIDKDRIKEDVNYWVLKLGIITDNPKKPVRTLSGGNQQKVVIAKWLSKKPQLLILNGPTVGVDIGAKEDIHNLIKDLAEDGMGVLMITDDIEELRQNCNRVLIMNKGRLVGEISGREFKEDVWNSMQEDKVLSR
ncbi:sugar ABC transporter ATP-binding protein [Ureibacillus sp. GCM10028918]